MTNNKQADAERIAEFLVIEKAHVAPSMGAPKYNIYNLYQNKNTDSWGNIHDLQSWLASDASTVAMIEALRTRDICALVEVIPAKNKNLNACLQSAILELIGGSDG